MRRFMSFIAGAMCGALVGSVTALLMAPSSGEALQRRMRDRAATFRDEVQDAYETRMAQLQAELDSLRKPPEPVEE